MINIHDQYLDFIILELQESKIVSTEGLVPLYCALAAKLKKPTHARGLCQKCKKKKRSCSAASWQRNHKADS